MKLTITALALVISQWALDRIKTGTGVQTVAAAGAVGLIVLAALLVRPAALPLACAIILAFGWKTFSFGRDIDFFWGPGLVVAATIAALVMNQMVAADATGVHTSVAVGLFKAEGGGIAALVRQAVRRLSEETTNASILFFWFPWATWKMVLLIAMTLGGAAAYVVRTRDILLPSYALFYGGLLMVTPWQGGPRYLLPLVPVLLVFLWFPLRDFDAILRGARLGVFGFTRLLVVSLVGAVLLGAVAQGNRDTWSFRDDEISDAQTTELVGWLKSNVPPADTICTFKPRAIMYLAQRRTCDLPAEAPAPLGGWLKAMGAQYAVAMLRFSQYRSLASRDDPSVAEVFRNSDYAVFIAVAH